MRSRGKERISDKGQDKDKTMVRAELIPALGVTFSEGGSKNIRTMTHE